MLNAKNKVNLTGIVTSGFCFDHEIYHEKFYLVNVSVKRLSGVADVLPVMVSEHLFEAESNYMGAMVTVCGQYRSHTYYGDNGKRHLQLYVFADNIELAENGEMANNIFLEGRICKRPTFRVTPRGREIAELLIAIDRPYGKTDRIPCIAWESEARKTQIIGIDDRVRINGRIQSRTYSKKINETESEWRTAYEVSANDINLSEAF